MKLLIPSLYFLLLQSALFSNAQPNNTGAGIGLSFNSNGYVNLGDVFNGTNFPVTIEAWVNPSFTASYNPIFTGDNNTSNYYGIELRIDDGVVFFSLGDGSGNGPSDRKGVYGKTEISPNRWTHIACVAVDANTFLVYINGVKDGTISTGNSNATNLVWSGSSASIGRYNDFYQDVYWFGMLDEIRFWNAARTETEIRNLMCKKADPNAIGLLGYWTADESYSSNTVIDYTTPSENGTISGNVTKITSGAAIGDNSEYLYTTNFTDISVSIFSASGERLGIDSINGNPHGVHVYRVDSLPYITNGLSATPPYYFGVFCAESNSTADYTVFYRYRNNNGIFNISNENDLALLSKSDGSAINWIDLNGSHNLVANRIKKSNQTSRGEYMLNLNDAEKNPSNNFYFTSQESINAFPNPAQDHFVVDLFENTNAAEFNLYTLDGKLLSQQLFSGSQIIFERGEIPNGIYLFNIMSHNNLLTKGEIVFQ